MGKLISGGVMFIIGLAMCFTGVGLVVGIPMLFGSFFMMFAGIASLGKTAVVAGVKGGKLVHEMARAADERAAVEAETEALAAARLKLLAEREAFLQESGNPSQSLGSPTPRA